jgi:hypothetical protein
MILGLDVITLSLIIAISGTILHQVRTYNGKPFSKKLDGVMISIGGSYVATHTILSEITGIDPFQQTLLVLSLIGVTIPGATLGQKAFTKIKQKVKPNTSDSKQQRQIPIKKEKFLAIPTLVPVHSWYQSNFVPSEKGNSLQYGQVYLWIRIKDVKSYVTVILKDTNGIALQIDQSHYLDEDGSIETTRLELLKADGTPFPRGIYHLQIQGDRGTGDSIGIKKDTFEII